MNNTEYYTKVFNQLANSFEGSYWTLGYGQELIQHGWNPDALLVTAEPVDQLHKMTVDWNLEVFVPVLGLDEVLFSKDAEIF